MLIFNLSTIKSCLTKSLLSTTSFFGTFAVAIISGLVPLKRLSCATNKTPLIRVVVDSFAGCVKLPIAQMTPTVIKDMAIMAIILLNKRQVENGNQLNFYTLRRSTPAYYDLLLVDFDKLWSP